MDAFPSAFSEKIDWLYHYQSGNLAHLAETLTNSTLHFSNPRYFNDPWDSKPFFYIPSNEDPEKEIITNQLIAGAKPPLNSAEETLYRKEMQNAAFFEKSLLDMTNGLREHFFSTYRLYCLSEKSDCELMWAHYADKHKGLLLQFSTKKTIFGGAYKIEYQKEYPKILPQKNLITAKSALLTKSVAWQYEQEYRVLAFDEGAQSVLEGKAPKEVIVRKNKLIFDLSNLVSITFGCLFPPDEISTYKKVIQSLAPHIQLRQAYKIENNYQLGIDVL